MTDERVASFAAHDGREIPAFLALPEGAAPAPGLVVVQEIFGITDYIRGACRRLAALGYVALAPALYDRIEPGLALDERAEDSLPRAFAAVQRLDFAQAVDDTVAALEHLRTRPEVSRRRAGVLGFCLGGGIAYFVAARSDPDVAVCYYGSAIPGGLAEAGAVHCPILFHFGEADEYVTAEQRGAVERAFAGREHTEFHRHPGANHAFDNHNAAQFHHAEAAARAWEQTQAFLRRELPVSP